MIRVTHTELERAIEICQLAASNPWCPCKGSTIKPHRATYPVIAMAVGMYDPEEDDETTRISVGTSVALAEETLFAILDECPAAWELEADLEAQARLEEGRLPKGWELIPPDQSLVN